MAKDNKPDLMKDTDPKEMEKLQLTLSESDKQANKAKKAM